MSLVSHINKYCPNGVSHSHCNGYNMNNKITKKTCALCTNNKTRKNFCMTCSKHCETKIICFDKEQIKNIRLCLTFSDKYYLPTEIQDIIINFGTYTEIIYIPILLNTDGIKHIMSCRQCSLTFINWMQKESCSYHMLPRISDSNNNYNI